MPESKPPSGDRIDVSEQETLVTLIQAAREDRKFRRKVLKILRLEPFHRKSALGTYVSDMQLKGAPPSFVQAIALPRDDRVAEQALELLEEAGKAQSTQAAGTGEWSEGAGGSGIARIARCRPSHCRHFTLAGDLRAHRRGAARAAKRVRSRRLPRWPFAAAC